MRRVLALGFGIALTGSATAGFVFTDAGPIISNGPVGNAVNDIRTFNHAGAPFQAGTFVIEGDLTEVNTGTFASEARVRIIDPSGAFFDTPALSATGNFTGTIHIGPSTATGGTWNIANSVGTWTFRFFESFDDGGTASIDANWFNFSLRANDALPPDTNQTINLGTMPNDGSLVCRDGDLRNAGLIDRYDFTLANGVSNINDYLSIRTSGGTTNFDTELGLFDLNTGLCVATDDDDGAVPGLSSNISIAGSATADPFNEDNLDGADGAALPAGNYALLVGGFNTNFTVGQAIGAVTGGTATGNYTVCFNHVPEPTSLVLLALGGLALVRRR